MQDRHSDTLIQDTLASLNEGRALLEGLSDDIYLRAMPPIFSYGIGSHVRHLLDFHTAFLNGLESGQIDYDSRERDESVEKSRRAAVVKIGGLLERLQALKVRDDAFPLLVRLEDASCDAETWSQSTLLREMQFLQSHTVHHYAMIAMMLRLQSVAVNESFGVATSTLKQWRAA